MGKSLMVLVFSFLILSVVLTSCSSDDSSEVTQTNPNDLVVVAFKATGEGTNIENFARDKEGTKVLSLDGQSNNVSFTEVTISKNGTNSDSSFTINGRNVTTKSGTPVGEYSISYRITNGSTTTESTTQTFTVFHNETKTFDNVVAKVLDFSINGYVTCTNSCQEFVLDGVPYQYLVNETYMFQLCFNEVIDTPNNFLNQTGYGEWRIVKLEQIELLLPQSIVINRNIRIKEKSSIKYLELRANSTQNSNGNYDFDSSRNNCGWSDAPSGVKPTVDSGVTFDCMDI